MWGRRVDPPRAPASRHVHFLLHSLPLESLRFKRSNYALCEFPSLKGYQIGREFPRTLTPRLCEDLGPRKRTGEGVVGAALEKLPNAVSCPLTRSPGAVPPETVLPGIFPPSVTSGLPSGLPPGTSSSRPN